MVCGIKDEVESKGQGNFIKIGIALMVQGGSTVQYPTKSKIKLNRILFHLVRKNGC